MEFQERKNTTYKLIIIGITSTLIILVLIARLFYIQVLKSEVYTTEVNRQRNIFIPLNSGRGLILDRNYIPLTDRQEETVLVVFTRKFVVNDDSLALLEEITGLSTHIIKNRLKTSNLFVEFNIREDVNIENFETLRKKGIVFVNTKERYEDRQVLSHIIGYINKTDRIGLSGIERAFNDVLYNSFQTSLVVSIDGIKRLLPGEGYQVVASNKNNIRHIKLTIDYTLQRIVEDVLDNRNRSGSIIVSNIQTGEILAFASSPSFNPNEIHKHLHSSGDELFNKGLQMTFPPGSLFKTIVAAAALENNLVELDEEFTCNGQQAIGNVVIRCNSFNEGGNETITFKEAFAKSCNSTFIQVGQRVGADNIIKMARRMGLGEVIDIGIHEEERGYLPSGDKIRGPAIGNISIGQGEIEVTPLQMNQITQIIANGGMKRGLYLIDSILDDDYNEIHQMERGVEKKILSPHINDKLKTIKKLVMEEGTGTGAIGHLASVTGGKTGSAQSSHMGREVLHAWFSGYYPSDNPQYAITIFLQNGGSGGRNAVPIFKEILDKIVQLK